MQPRTAIKTDLFAADAHRQKIDALGDPLSVDNKYEVIRKIETGTASTHDSQHFAAVLDQSNTSRDVHADRGYPSEAREDQRKAAGLRNPIQRKGKRNEPLSACQERRNRRIAKARARVEHGCDRADGWEDDPHDWPGTSGVSRSY